MMIELKLGGFNRARVWIGEIPDDLACQPEQVTSVTERRLVAGSALIFQRRTAALELYRPKGAYTEGGILGAEFIPQSEQLLICTLSCDEDGPLVPWSLMSPVDEVHAGIPSWLVAPVAEAAEEACRSRGIGPGMLRFGWGAHGAAGSSAALFKRLARSLVDLLLTDPSALSNTEEIQALLQRR